MNQDYSATTKGITVRVRSAFLDEQSRPDEGHYLWAYRVRIENKGDVAVQLLRRSWMITDARGRVQEVHGDGVVGETPVIEPGCAYEYQSGTPLATPSGVMTGQYHMIETGSGDAFDAEIPPFSLDSPYQPGRVH
jgi:ApaG protein